MSLLPREQGERFGWRRRFDLALSFAAIVLVIWFYAWTVVSGGGLGSGGGDDLCIQLVRGFRKGHLHLDRTPPAELIALPDPYDPARNGPYRLPDATYYRGHFYLYFGAVPAVVLMLPYAVITGRELPTGPAVLVFCVVGFLAASGLWLALRRRYFPQSAVWTGALGVIVLGMSTHLLALARRPMVWELPIASGFAFVMLALVAVYAAVHGRRPLVSLGLAGLSLGLAMASRPPNLFGAAMLLIPWWVLVWRAPRPAAAWWRYGLAATAGLALCGLAMLAYNYARFENPLEFGQNYQLTSSRELGNRHFGLDYIPHNLGVYYLCPLRWSWDFPFGSAHTPSWSNPDYAGGEEMCGFGVTFPFLWLALAAPLAWWRRSPHERRSLWAMVGAVVGLYLGVGCFLLSFFSTTERYMAEFGPALALLALGGWLGLERWAQGVRWRVGLWAVTVLAAVATVPLGVLVSLNYHGNTLSRDNPVLWSKLERASYEAISQAGLWMGRYEGPRVLKVRFALRPAGTVETIWRATDERAGERILVEHLAERELRFGFVRGTEPVRWGRRLTWQLDHTHTVELQLPSLYGAPKDFAAGVRRLEEFRERTGVAVWFSGGRALSAVVGPLAKGMEPGGMIGADFSGDMRRIGKRVFRTDEVAQAEEPPWPRGGTLHLRVILPEPLAPEGEPLFATGALYGSDILLLRDAGNGAVTVSFEHFGAPAIMSAPIPLVPGREHTIELVLPSASPANFCASTKGDVVVRLNGQEVLRALSETQPFGAGSETIGRNPFGMSSTREFRGWILEARWVAAR